MTKLENGNFKLDENLKELSSKIEFLQDLILQMKYGFEILAKNKVQENFLSQITKSAIENLDFFLNERAVNCKILDKCALMTEKSVFKVLKTFVEQGSKSALQLMNSYEIFLKTPKVETVCTDHECLENANKIFKTLEELINISEVSSRQYTEDLLLFRKSLNFKEGTEEKLCRLISPLSNVIRLKILKNLSEGGKYYKDLEEHFGIKAGHLLFHLEKLIKAGYVSQENKKYIITVNGLRVLKLLLKLSEDLISS